MVAVIVAEAKDLSMLLRLQLFEISAS